MHADDDDYKARQERRDFVVAQKYACTVGLRKGPNYMYTWEYALCQLALKIVNNEREGAKEWADQKGMGDKVVDLLEVWSTKGDTEKVIGPFDVPDELFLRYVRVSWKKPTLMQDWNRFFDVFVRAALYTSNIPLTTKTQLLHEARLLGIFMDMSL